MSKRLFSTLGFILFIVLLSTQCKKDENTETVLTGLDKAKKDYTENYLGSSVTDPIWTGTTAGCAAGDISAIARNKVIQRVNYFRRLVGLKDNVTLNSSQSQKCQEAALYMIANATLTHYPASTGSCYTAGALDAASHGNIAYSKGYDANKANHTVNAVTGYIEDPGSGNLQVGHRAWILYPELSALGSGSVWRASDKYATDCMMWGGNLNGSTVGGPAFVAYPSATYFPSALVFPRWSFSIKGANFSTASVSMTDKNGAVVTVNVIHKGTTNGSPDARIAWEPSGINITADTEFNVTISGIKAAAQTSYTYKVTVFYVAPNAKKASSNSGISEIL